MVRTSGRLQELALPVASLAAMRYALTDAVGEDAAARALRMAGHAAGEALSQILQDDAESGRGQSTFFRRLSELFANRGWGHFVHHTPHEGVGQLDAPDLVEAIPESDATRPSCYFMTGMLANLLGRAASAEIAVLEVECRSRGDARCRFLFGAPETLHAVYDASLHGAADLDSALAALD